MNKLNLIFTLSSLSVLLVTIERFSLTTKILLQPYNFIRLHEIVQISLLTLLTVLLPVLLLKEVTQNFNKLNRKEVGLLLSFITGVYFYATGNGVHELASFLFNNYCNIEQFSGDLCGGFFFNDYYFGNILYFTGGFLMVSSILLLERNRPNKEYKKGNLPVLVVNSVIYSLAIFAYVAFDKVLVGLAYSVIMTLFALALFVGIRKRYLEFPVITYTTLTYFLGTAFALFFKLLIR